MSSDFTFENTDDPLATVRESVPAVPKVPNYTAQGIDIRFIDKYKLVTEAFQGSDGFCDGSYLLPHQREAFFRDRQVMSYYRNYMKPIVESIVNPVINGVTRKTSSDLYNEFLEDVDFKGNSINNNIIDVLTNSRIHGNTFVVMDNFSNQPTILKDAIASRTLPYIYIQPAYTVEKYSANKFGNLENISFFEYVTDPDTEKTIKIVTYWDSKNTIITKYDGSKKLSEEVKAHGFGVLPVIQVNSTIDKTIMPFPPFYDIAKLEYALYNKDSEIRDQERAQAFSVLYVQTDVPQQGISLGPHNVIIIPANEKITMPPGYISPDSSILTTLVANSKELVNAIYRAAQDQGTEVVQRETSGIAEGYKFVGTANQLKKSAEIAREYETKLVELFNTITNSNTVLELNYKREFYPAIGRGNIDDTLKLLQMDLSDDVKHEIKNVLIRDILSHLEPERLDELTVLEPEQDIKDDKLTS